MQPTKLLLVFAALLASCASTGIIPADRDTFMLAKTSGGGALGSAAGVLAEIYTEANAFCAGHGGKMVEKIEETRTEGIPFVRMAGADLRFRCVQR
jgi:hypothetical protein